MPTSGSQIDSVYCTILTVDAYAYNFTCRWLLYSLLGVVARGFDSVPGGEGSEAHCGGERWRAWPGEVGGGAAW